MIMDPPPRTPIMIPRIIPSQLDIVGVVVWATLANVAAAEVTLAIAVVS